MIYIAMGLCWLACFLWWRTACRWKRQYEEAVDGWKEANDQNDHLLSILNQQTEQLNRRAERDPADWWKNT